MKRALIIGACALYILGVQLPTITINIPLNNQLQSIDLFALSDTEVAETRSNFEARWNQWNSIRTTFATLTALMRVYDPGYQQNGQVRIRRGDKSRPTRP